MMNALDMSPTESEQSARGGSNLKHNIGGGESNNNQSMSRIESVKDCGFDGAGEDLLMSDIKPQTNNQSRAEGGNEQEDLD